VRTTSFEPPVCNIFSPFIFQLLNVIRDNSVVIIVGETGSGKTTQLTQVTCNFIMDKM